MHEQRRKARAGTTKNSAGGSRRKNAGSGFQFNFHGAFAKKSDAVAKERTIPGGFIKTFWYKSGPRYAVLTAKNPRKKTKAELAWEKSELRLERMPKPIRDMIAPGWKPRKTKRNSPPDKIAGHEGWKELMVTRLVDRYGELRRSGYSPDQAEEQTLQSSTAGKGAVAEFRRRIGSRNPRRRNYFQEDVKSGSRVAVISANESTGPFSIRLYVDNGNVATLTVKKAKTIAGARKIAQQMLQQNPRRNPATADELYTQFHGRGPSRVDQIQVSITDPYEAHPDLAQLGRLISLYVGEGVRFTQKQHGTEVFPIAGAEGSWSRKITFPNAAPDVAGEPGGRQIFIVGGNQNLDSMLASLGADPGKDFIDLGFCYRIEYHTKKVFDRLQPVDYWHLFGEDTGVCPRLTYDRINKLIQLVGGEYVVKPEGIVN